MTSSGKAELTLPAEDQILIRREFDAPKHLVYRAYTEPDLVRRWWSGRRGSVTLCEIDLRVGGAWRYVMAVEGEDFEIGFHGEYREIVPDERLVSTEVFEGMPGVEAPEEGTLNTLTLTEQDGRTTLEVLVACPSREVRDAIIESGMEGGMQESYDALEEVAISLR